MGKVHHSLALLLPSLLLPSLLLVTSPGSAAGQPGDAEAAPAPSRAAQLFDDGLKEMLAGHYDSACPKLAESFTLEPLAGAEFTLAECEDQRGRIGTALRHYQGYLRRYWAMTPGKRVRQRGRNERTAQQIAALEKRVPRLELVLPADAPPGTVVEHDGEPIASTALGIALPADPGVQQYTIRLPTGEERQQDITLTEGERARLLLQLPDRAEATGGSAEAGDGDGTSTDLRTWAYVIGGVGAANLVVGIITGAMVLNQKSTIEDNCDGTACNSKGKETADSAQDLATVSTITFAVGLAGLAAGTAVWLLAPGQQEPATAGWAPFVGGTPGSVSGAVAGVTCRW